MKILSALFDAALLPISIFLLIFIFGVLMAPWWMVVINLPLSRLLGLWNPMVTVDRYFDWCERIQKKYGMVDW